jgi:D-xylose transport system substrate-binding protein
MTLILGGTSVRSRIITLVAVAAVSALALAGCSSSGKTGTSASPTAAGKTYKIALLLPETKTTRYEAFDKPIFESTLQGICPTCVVDYYNANQDENLQLTQFESAISKGDQVIVLDPVNGATAKTMIDQAKTAKVPVISYDRLVTDTDGLALYISFDNEKVGELQGQALLDGLKAAGKASGNIVMIDGSPTDNNATLFAKGAHTILDAATSYKIVDEFKTPDWSPDKAQAFMEGEIQKLGKNGFVGVLAANDGTAGGAYAAMKAAGISPIPPMTGQDAQLDAIQRIVAGQQYVTIYKPFSPEASAAATAAYALASGAQIGNLSPNPVDNGVQQVPSILLTPTAVTVKNINDTIIKDNFYTAADICTADYAAACTAAGIK